ncbi:phosphotransferase [Salana multivorans]
MLGAQADPVAAGILSYNPARHLVLDLPGGEVLRISHRRLDDVLRVAEAWHEAGAPTLPLSPWRDRPDVLVAERWGRGDLAALRHDPAAGRAAETVGVSIARLHHGEQSRHRRAGLPSARTGGRVPAVVHALRTLLPDRADPLARLAARLDETLPAAPSATLVHGDLSPDQVLAGDPAATDPTVTEAAPPIRIIDLDRSGLGAAGLDLGSWLAWCLVEEAPDLGAAFLAGYTCEQAAPARREPPRARSPPGPRAPSWPAPSTRCAGSSRTGSPGSSAA